MTGEEQYLKLCKKIIDAGQWVYNERTGTWCKTIINADLEYNVGAGEFPLVTTRKAFYKSAVAELLGYLRGYDNAEAFQELGTPTWHANANENQAWLDNPHRKCKGDMGRVYGVQGRRWIDQYGRTHDQLTRVINDLKEGIDNRGEIITYWNPGEFDRGCLRPCMHSFQFSLLGDTLYLHAYQRSIDVPLGLVFNMPQVYTMLALVAQITGHKPGIAYHKLVNCHIYENQIELMQEQIKRAPFAAPTLHLNPEIKSLKDVEEWAGKDDFYLAGYKHHDAISYPFSV